MKYQSKTALLTATLSLFSILALEITSNNLLCKINLVVCNYIQVSTGLIFDS
jgi:hypothetical protein